MQQIESSLSSVSPNRLSDVHSCSSEQSRQLQNSESPTISCFSMCRTRSSRPSRPHLNSRNIALATDRINTVIENKAMRGKYYLSQVSVSASQQATTRGLEWEEKHEPVYSWPKPSVSSTAVESLLLRASYDLYGGRSRRLKLFRTLLARCSYFSSQTGSVIPSVTLR